MDEEDRITETSTAEEVVEPETPIIEGEWVDKYEMPHPGDDYDY